MAHLDHHRSLAGRRRNHHRLRHASCHHLHRRSLRLSVEVVPARIDEHTSTTIALLLAAIASSAIATATSAVASTATAVATCEDVSQVRK